jgi:hypothetical protein
MVIEIRISDVAFKGLMLVFTIGADELYQEPNSVLFSKILRKGVEEVEENIALNTLGTIIHETLKSL